MATKVGSAYFDVTFNTTAARRELTALVSVANRQFGLLGGVALVGATVALGAATQATVQLGQAALGMANEYEHAFARVRKTLDDGTLSAEETAQAFGTLNRELRGLALDIPLDLSSEIAEIAALGGQMGIQRDEITEFTRVIGELGVTTTLSVEDAATQFARLSNIVGLPSSQFRNMADDLVHLGNNFAATEDEILRFSLRIAAAGEIVGFSESDILALASAMTAVGVPAERGGTAVQRTLIRMQKAVSQGTQHLDTFGRVSGMTAEEFAQAWQTDPARAFQSFIEGVGRSGDAAFGILQNTELANERTIQSLLSLANAGDLFGYSLDTVAESTGAAAREADIFFDTTTSKLVLLGNAAKDAGITMGDEMQEPFRELIDMGIEWIATNDVLITQIGTNLAAALEGITPILLTAVDLVANLTLMWSDFIASLNETPEGGTPGMSRMQEWQDFLQRGLLFDPHIARGIDILPGNLGEGITQLTIIEDKLRKMVHYGGQLDGHRFDQTLGGVPIVESMTEVEMLTAAFVELDSRLDPIGQKITRLGWDELTDELKLTDDELRQVIANLQEAGVALPREILIELGLAYVSGRTPRGRGAGEVERRGLGGQPPLDFDELAADQDAAKKEAQAWANAVRDSAARAAELNIGVEVLLRNLDELAPDLAATIDPQERGAIASTLYAEALHGLQNSLNFDISNVTDSFDLLLTTVNKAGKEVPTTVGQMLRDLRKQAQVRAEFEAGTTILRLLGFDDLANEIATYDPQEAITALRGFLADLDSAAEAEDLLSFGGTLGEEELEALRLALAEGDITPEIINIVKQLTSREVRNEVQNQANSLVGLIGQELLSALENRPDIRVPIQLIPEITYGAGWPGGDFSPPSGGGGGGGGRGGQGGGGGVTLNMYTPGVRTTDAARAGNLIHSLIGVG